MMFLILVEAVHVGRVLAWLANRGGAGQWGISLFLTAIYFGGIVAGLWLSGHAAASIREEDRDA